MWGHHHSGIGPGKRPIPFIGVSPGAGISLPGVTASGTGASDTLAEMVPAIATEGNQPKSGYTARWMPETGY